MKRRVLIPLLAVVVIAFAVLRASRPSRPPNDLRGPTAAVPAGKPATSVQSGASISQAAAPAIDIKNQPVAAGGVVPPPEKIPGRVPARSVIASGWKTESEPELAAFVRWTDRYLASPEGARAGLVPEGLELARQRRMVLAQLIRSDPERALAAAVPFTMREQLPGEIVALLEERVSGHGELSLNGVTPVNGQAVAEPLFRSALVNGREYRTFAYGRRATLATLPETSIIGVAVDGALAVSDSPVRVLEPNESAGRRSVETVCVISGKTTPVSNASPLNVTEATAVEVDGGVHVLCEPAHVILYEAQLRAREHVHEVNAADGQPGSSSVTGRPDQAWTHGPKRVLIIRVDFPDLSGTPVNPFDSQTITEDYAVNRFNAAGGVRDYYERGSFGKTTLQITPTAGGDSPDVTGVLRMPQNASDYATAGNNSSLHSDARAAAAAAGFAVDTYDRIGVIFAKLSALPGSQIQYGGLGNIIGRNFWINGYFTFNIAAHEIGHNYGLNHANLWQVSDGNPVSLAGSSVEYGDLFDVMGSGNTPESEFSHWNKSIVQWIPDSAVATISSSGLYRVYRFDDAAANLANVLVLKIVRDDTRDYWIGHRRATGNSGLDNGAYVLWGYNANRQANLLDLTTPGNDASDAALTVGTTFNDSAAGIAIQPVARGGSGADEWLDVQVTLQPRVAWSRATFYADEQGGNAVLTLTRSYGSAGAVRVDYATANGTASAPDDFASQSGTVNWADGDLAPKTITIPLVPDTSPEGTESFTVTLMNAVGAVIVGPTATVTIADPGIADPQFAPAFINNRVERVIVQPDGKVVIAGWFSLIQDNNIDYARVGIARLQPDGSLDTAFALGGGVAGGSPTPTRVEDMARQPDGRFVIAGNFTSVHGAARSYLARLNVDGSLDTSFGIGTGPNDIVNTVLVQPDGKTLIGGKFTTYDGTAREYVARLNEDGSLDTGFAGPDFSGTAGWSVEALALQPDGRILVAGVFYFSGANFKAGLCRLNTNGGLDAAFDGVAEGAHSAGNPLQLRRIYRVVPQLDSSILIAGDFTAYNNTPRGGLARVTSTGALDLAFAPTTDGDCFGLFSQPDGKILVGGTFSTLNGTPVNRLGRLTSSGTLDPTFPTGGTDASVYTFALQPDGRMFFAGNFGTFQIQSGPIRRFFSGMSALPGTVQWITDVVTSSEGSSVLLTATRTGGSSGALSVNYATVPGTATAADFTPTSGILSWPDGDSAPRSVSISIAADAIVEGTESFVVNLGSPLVGSAVLGVIQQTTVDIGVAATGFAAWQAANFTPAELADPAIGGQTADPDLDGIKNILEYAFGLLPKTPDTSGSPVGAIQNIRGTDYLTITFRRRLPAADLTYSPRTADSVFGPWNADAAQVGQPVNNADGTETVTYRDSAPAGQPSSQRFMRVEITYAP